MTNQDAPPDGKPGFWDDKFGKGAHLFGQAPNAFIAVQSLRLPEAARVLELGAGDGRNAVFLARHGHDVTAVDFSRVALDQAAAHAGDAGVDVELIQADVRTWTPDQPVDAVVATFLQLLPPERPAFWTKVRDALRPGGLFIGVFFRPEQLTGGYTSGGPPSIERMITGEELQAHFAGDGFQVLETTEVVLDEGMMRGPAAVLHVVWKRTDEDAAAR